VPLAVWIEQKGSAKAAQDKPVEVASLHQRPDLPTEYVAPRDDLEAEIAGIWAELLGVQQVGIHDSFFLLGGHSLLGMQLLSRIREQLKGDIPLRSLFETPTVAGLALLVVQQRASHVDDEALSLLLAEIEQAS
ncbi:phosphopantetheine-binding protein, partial [Stigmatella aurantiaca]|uniref:phosphopantetheine-binding protein n=1 Tax=Stigmatella aurantiaca TaxID=41 RepID=UPI000567D599